MPELPEVETVKRLLEKQILHKKINHIILNRKNLRFDMPTQIKEIKGQRVQAMTRHGKYMLWHLSNDHTIIIHLGMSGRFVFSKDQISVPDFYHHHKIKPEHEHIIFSFEDTSRLSYYDPRRFGFFDYCKTDSISENKFIKILGVDGLDILEHQGKICNIIQKKRNSIKNILMDQTIITGVGNIYASEALWRSKVMPTRISESLDHNEIAEILKNIFDVLDEAIKVGGSTLKDYKKPDGNSGNFQNKFDAYDRQNMPCQRENCSGLIQKMIQSARATYFCASCQK